MYYLLWVPLTFLWYYLYTWFIYKNSLTIGFGGWFWAAALMGGFPLWVLVSRYSKDIMFDGIIYDIALFLGCAIGAGIFTGKIYSFNTIQWIGLLLTIVGLFMVKFK